MVQNSNISRSPWVIKKQKSKGSKAILNCYNNDLSQGCKFPWIYVDLTIIWHSFFFFKTFFLYPKSSYLGIHFWVETTQSQIFHHESRPLQANQSLMIDFHFCYSKQIELWLKDLFKNFWSRTVSQVEISFSQFTWHKNV